jgi:hypothetical protein
VQGVFGWPSGALSTLDDPKPGLVLVATVAFSAASSASINGCFTSRYDNYLLTVSGTCTTNTASLLIRLRLAGVDATSAIYGQGQIYVTSVAGPLRVHSVSQTFGQLGNMGSESSAIECIITSPALAAHTAGTGVSHGGSSTAMQTAANGFLHSTATAYDGLTVTPGAGTITGVLSIFGYVKQ